MVDNLKNKIKFFSCVNQWANKYNSTVYLICVLLEIKEYNCGNMMLTLLLFGVFLHLSSGNVCRDFFFKNAALNLKIENSLLENVIIKVLFLE